MYNLVTQYNLENLENRVFDDYYFILSQSVVTREQKDTIYNLAFHTIESNQFYSDELIYLSYYSIFGYNRGETLNLDLIKKINDYVPAKQDLILNVNYLEFMLIQLYCYNEIEQESATKELRNIYLNFFAINIIDNVSSSFRLTGRMERNYQCVLEGRLKDIEIRRLFSSLSFN